MHRLELHNKRVLITGAAHGLGRELALLLEELGCLLFLVDYDAQGLALLAPEFTRQPQMILCDLSNLVDRKKLIQTLKDQVTVDILINCAGVGSHSMLSQLTVDEIERVIQVNVLAPLELIAGLSPLELVVNIGSVSGEMCLPSLSLYGASKTSLHAFTRSIHLEGAPALLAILGSMRGTNFVQSIQHPRTGQPKWYRDLDVDVKVAAKAIVRAMQSRKDHILLPRWYRVVFIVAGLLQPLLRIYGRQIGFGKSSVPFARM